MATQEDLPLFQAAVRNSREAGAAVNIFRHRLNEILCSGSVHELRVHTSLYCLLFSIWAEAELTRLVYTPYGFSGSEIAEILSQRSVEEKWKKVLEIGLNRTQLDPDGSLRQRFHPRLDRHIDEYIVRPAMLRNKIAHGQWIDPFNNDCSSLNEDTKRLLQRLDLVEVERWLFVFKRLSSILEDSIESPRRAFRRDSWMRIAEIDDGLGKMEKWTPDSKRLLLLRKYRRPKSEITA